MTPSVLHNTFTIDRTYGAAPARVFRAFEDPRLKRQWFAEGEGKLVYIEQGAYFDGADQPKDREEGCRELLG